MSSGLNLLNSIDKITVVQNNVNGLHDLTISSITDLQTQVDLRYQKAEPDSPLSKKEKVFNVQAPLIFTSSDLDSTPTLTSDTYSKNDTYTKSETVQKTTNLIDSAPAQLNTLNKLATAINDDSNFATTITCSIATKQPLLNHMGGMGSTILMIMLIV